MLKTITFSRDASAEEYEDLSRKLLDCLSKKQDLEEEKKQVAKDYKAQIDSLDMVINVHAIDLRGRKITRTMTVNFRKDYTRGEFVYFDPETGEEVWSEPFNAADWQTGIDDLNADHTVGHAALQIPETSETIEI